MTIYKCFKIFLVICVKWSLCPPIDSIWPVMIVWNMRTDHQHCSVLYCVSQLCTVVSTLVWAVLTGELWPTGFDLGPLCFNLFVFVYFLWVFWLCLSVSALTAWKHLSLKLPVMCQMGLTHSLLVKGYETHLARENTAPVVSNYLVSDISGVHD